MSTSETTIPAADVFPVLVVPSFATTAWVVETSPEDTRAWLANLPRADAPQTAQSLYQALFTLNRMALDLNARLQLMELYRPAVTAVAATLASQMQAVSLPLRPRFRQLAGFLIQLQLEMGYGYKRVLVEAHGEARPEDNDAVLLAVARAIESLGNALCHVYQAYVPTPAGMWREIHGLYRYAEFHDRQHLPLADLNNGEPLSVMRAYLQALMLGLCNPYQLPPGECQMARGFLGRWVERAMLLPEIEGTDPLGHFLVDLDADHPASPFPRDVSVHNQPALRAINAVELARTVHGFLARMQRREPVASRELGFECNSPGCVETLKRMLRFWGLAARRQFARRERRQPLSVCVGLPALHYFISGQQQLPQGGPSQGGSAAAVPSQAELDHDARGERPAAAATYHLDNRWQVRDESASGMLLARVGDLGPFVRVGELIGLHDAQGERWRLGVVRWVKSPDTRQVETGVEMLAPSAQALALRPQGVAKAAYEPALLIPPVPALRRPAMLLATPGSLRAGENFELNDGASMSRVVRILNVAEQSGSFVQAVFADAAP